MLKLYRADSIVKDCEALRQALTADYPDERKKWSIMGQGFGYVEFKETMRMHGC